MKRIVACLFFINLILLSATVFADFDAVTFDRDTHMINVSGNAGTDIAKQLVSVVLKCDENVNDIKLVRTDDNSDFECSFAVADKTAVYEISYQTPKTEESVTTSVNTYSSEVVQEALNTFSSADTQDDIELFFSEYTQILGFSEELLGEISDYGAFYTSLLSKPNDMEKVKDIVDLVNGTAIVQIFTEASASQISEFIEKYDELIGIPASALYKNYASFEDAMIPEFEEKMGNHTFATPADIIEAFEVCTILTEIQNAAYYTDTQLMVESYYDKLSIDMGDYNKLSNEQKKNVMKALTGSNSAKVSDFKTKWENAIGNASDTDSNTGNLNGGNPGGGISSGVTPGGGRPGSGGSGGGAGASGGTIEVDTSKAVPVKIVSFIDMEDAAWAKDAVLKLANNGVVNGKSEYRFYPNDDITRAEFIKILVGALGFEIKSSECNFNDVKAEDWAYPYVCTAIENKIVFGYSDTEFGAKDNITRQDMITMVMRALNRKNNIRVHNEYELTFNDTVQIADYALESIKNAVYYGIVNGMGNNCFEPKIFATRAQAALLIYQSTEVDFNN